MFLMLTSALCLGAGLVLGITRSTEFNWRWLLLAIALFWMNDFLLTRGFYLAPKLFPHAEWGWQGKAMALAGTLAVAAHPAFGWQRVGLTLRQQAGSLRASVPAILIYALYVIGLALIFPNEPVSGETFAFQLTMPGIEESAFFLGILLFALNRAFVGRITLLGVEWGWGVVLASLLFGLVHGLSYDQGAFHFDALNMLQASLPSFLVYWIRQKTGSLLIPALLHNFGNTISLVL